MYHDCEDFVLSLSRLTSNSYSIDFITVFLALFRKCNLVTASKSTAPSEMVKSTLYNITESSRPRLYATQESFMCDPSALPPPVISSSLQPTDTPCSKQKIFNFSVNKEYSHSRFDFMSNANDVSKKDEILSQCVSAVGNSIPDHSKDQSLLSITGSSVFNRDETSSKMEVSSPFHSSIRPIQEQWESQNVKPTPNMTDPVTPLRRNSMQHKFTHKKSHTSNLDTAIRKTVFSPEVGIFLRLLMGWLFDLPVFPDGLFYADPANTDIDFEVSFSLAICLYVFTQ